jgi:plasmid stabilization system protein ParE
MAQKSRRLKVVITPAAERDLLQIWLHNAEQYDVDHADGYLRFLKRGTVELETDHALGRQVPNHPTYRFIVLRKGRGHGHIVVYHILDEAVEVIRYYHTAQDWQSGLE